MQASTDKLNLILQSAFIGTWDWNLETGFIFWDEITHLIFGLSPGSFANSYESFESFVHEDDRALVKSKWQDSLENNTPYFVEIRIRAEDGSIRYVSTRGTLYRDSSGKPNKMVGIVWDITEQKLFQKQLEEALRFSNALFDAAGFSIISVNCDGVITSFNKAAERMLGYSSHELIYTKTPEIIHDKSEVEEYSRKLSEELEMHIEPGFEVFIAKTKYLGVSDEREWTYVRKDGSRFPVLLSVTAMRDSFDKVTGYLGIAIDITDKKQQENLILEKTHELERSNHDLEQFAYTTSHDLQEPLRMVASFSELLLSFLEKNNLLQDPKAAQYAAFIKDGVTRMKDLVKDILNYSRVGRREEARSLDLNEILESVLMNLSDAISRTSARVVIPKNLPKIFAQEVEMLQLFQNLIGNAIKFRKLDQEPVIEVKCIDNGDELLFSVADNGIGIKKDYFDKIFIIFQKLERRDKDSSGVPSTGIGLAICKKIVETHKGRIWVESVEGEGTTFNFTLKKK